MSVMRLMLVLAIGATAAACSGGTPSGSAGGDTSAFVGCPPSAQLSATDREEVRQGLANAVTRALQGDWTGFAQSFAENVSMLPPGAPAYAGRDRLVAGFEGVTMIEFVSEFDYLDGCGDVAYGRGHHSWAMQVGEGGEVFREDGKWVAVWRRQADGRWLVDTDTWNANGTATGQ